MSSRDEILTAIRTNRPGVEQSLPRVPLFDYNPRPLLLSMFRDSLHGTGGVLLDPPAVGDPMMPIRQNSILSSVR